MLEVAGTWAYEELAKTHQADSPVSDIGFACFVEVLNDIVLVLAT